jgi:hypothetical protein
MKGLYRKGFLFKSLLTVSIICIPAVIIQAASFYNRTGDFAKMGILPKGGSTNATLIANGNKVSDATDCTQTTCSFYCEAQNDRNNYDWPTLSTNTAHCYLDSSGNIKVSKGSGS